MTPPRWTFPEYRPFEEVADAALERVKCIGGDSPGITGVTTGIDPLDELLGGLQQGNLVVVVGGRRSGKSALALRVAAHAAQTREVLLCSPQLSGEEQLVFRFGAGRYLAPLEDGNDRYRDPRAGDRLIAGAQQVRGIRLAVFDLPRPRVGDVCSAARQLARDGVTRVGEDKPAVPQTGVGLVVVDQIELLRSDHPRRAGIDALTDAAIGLKSLSRELMCPVLAFCLHEPAAHESPETGPALDDLRQQNQVSHYADVVISINLPSPGWHRPLAHLAVLKNRNGPLAHCRIRPAYLE